MKPRRLSINISDFKAKALRLFEETATQGREFVIVKRGVPMAQVTPIQKNAKPRRGSLKGLVEICGDIVHLDTSEDWDALR